MLKLIPLILLISLSCSQNDKQLLKIEDPTPKIQKYLDDFVDSEWQKVYKSKDSLMVVEKEAIQHLIGLMSDEKRFVKLKNTADLIYPGATQFYGHGWFIDYDLDWIAIRAGWALEELTFQNFGFVENSITNIDLIQLHQDNYEEYIITGKQEVTFERESFKKLANSIDKATKWWINNEADWTNINAIKAAIYSKDITRQLNAIQHLRYPNYKSKGYTDGFYESELKPRIKELTFSSNEEVAYQAKLKLGSY